MASCHLVISYKNGTLEPWLPIRLAPIYAWAKYPIWIISWSCTSDIVLGVPRTPPFFSRGSFPKFSPHPGPETGKSLGRGPVAQPFLHVYHHFCSLVPSTLAHWALSQSNCDGNYPLLFYLKTKLITDPGSGRCLRFSQALMVK